MAKKKPRVNKDSFKEYLNSPQRSGYLNQQFKYFVKEIFNTITDENDYSYIDERSGTSFETKNDQPGDQIRPALTEMLEKKVSRESIIDLVRVVQYDAIFYFFQALECGEFIERGNWGFYFENPDGEPIYKVGEGELSYGFEEPEFLPRNIKKKIKAKKKASSKIKALGKKKTGSRNKL